VVLDNNGAKEWEVEEVLAQRGTGSKRQYLVKWKGWPLWEATWEKESNLENAQESLKEFQQKVTEVDAIRLNFLDTGRFREVENVTEYMGTRGALDSYEVRSDAVIQSIDTVKQSSSQAVSQAVKQSVTQSSSQSRDTVSQSTCVIQ
jgi:hypothetical protein